ncbi:hypothetical protein A9Q99_11515 [Gammaproteobacteria bacterium 45_16_T64]|nr:hypothetical protein A9Q99_11515 [Gammaproteobacteria bacterium 45_16_T64]
MVKVIRTAVVLIGMLTIGACSTLSQQEFGSSYSFETRQFDELRVDDFTPAPKQAMARAHFLASPEVVFAKLGDHENMNQWMPFINHEIKVDHSNSRTPGKSDVGTVRICDFAGDKLTESILYWEEGKSYAYTVLPGDANPALDHLGVITVEPDGKGGSLVSWRQYFEPKPWSLKGNVMPTMIGVVMNMALDNLVDEYGGEVL